LVITAKDADPFYRYYTIDILKDGKPAGMLSVNGFSLDINVEPDLPKILVDRDHILQVLTNLVGNAPQYTPDGGKVTIRAVREKSEIIISIYDQPFSPRYCPEPLRQR